MFLLVIVWVNRSFKPARPFILERWWRKYRGLPRQVLAEPNRSPRWAWTVPHGIFAFMLATGGFWYAYVHLVHFPARPAPVVSVATIQPGTNDAMVIANINSQSQDTTWRVDFGPSVFYGQTTGAGGGFFAGRSAGCGEAAIVDAGGNRSFSRGGDERGGSIATPDFSFVNAGKPVEIDSEPIGGIDWPSCSVWLRLLALFIIMIVAAQMLPPAHRGWACGAVAAMLVWFDPMILIDSHAWPQWDVWILPFFIFAALLASLNWWVMAGMLFGIGCMLKGQMLLGAPILILWPFLEGRYGALWRVIVGFLLGAELVTWPWIVNSHESLKWIETAMVGALVILAISWLRKPLMASARRWVIDPILGKRMIGSRLASMDVNREFDSSATTALLQATAVLAGLVIATWLVFYGIADRRSELWSGTLGLFVLVVLVPPFFLRRMKLPYWFVGVFAIAVAIASIAFNGSYSWAELGFANGSVKHDEIQMSIRNLSNLTSVLAQSYGWDIHDPMGTLRFSFKTPGPWRLGSLAIPSVDRSWAFALDVKNAMALLYGICLFMASAAAALHHRRNDRRFLVALVVPWAVFPIVMCQMGDRYPIWASALSAGMVAVSLELSLLHVLLAAVPFAMVTRQLVTPESSRWPQLFDLTTPWYPGMGWLMVFVAGIFLVASLVPSRKCLGE